MLRNGTYAPWEALAARHRASAPTTARRLPSGIPRYASTLPLASTERDIEAVAMCAGQGAEAIVTVEPGAAIPERIAATLPSPAVAARPAPQPVTAFAASASIDALPVVYRLSV